MFITIVHLLTSRNFLREFQTSIHIILAHQRHNSLALSTLGLKYKKKPFHALVSKSGMRCLMNTKIWQRNPSKKETKRALLNILETKDPYTEPDEIMLKVKKQQNWIKLNQFHNNFRTLRNARTFPPLQWISAIFLFFCVSFCPFMLYFFISVLFPV